MIYEAVYWVTYSNNFSTQEVQNIQHSAQKINND
jgi:hypothetical protein